MLENLSFMLLSVTLKIIALCPKLCSCHSFMLDWCWANFTAFPCLSQTNYLRKLKTQHFNVSITRNNNNNVQMSSKRCLCSINSVSLWDMAKCSNQAARPVKKVTKPFYLKIELNTYRKQLETKFKTFF